MAILKHIANKSKIYSGAEQYLCFEHDAKTGKPLLDDQSRMIVRKGILKEAINCDFDSFAAECMETNNLYHKNKGTADIKSHDYILSFDPKDDITPMEAMELAKKYADKFLEGHQVIIVVHPDGHNGSGNIHAHIVANSVRKYPAVKQEWHEKTCEYKQGCKHKCTNAMLRSGKQWVMDECRKRGLNQVDLFHSKIREDYWVQKRGLEKAPDFITDKDKLRIYVDAALPYATSMEHFAKLLYEKYEVTTRITNQIISFKLASAKQAIRGNRLGDDYAKPALEERMPKLFQERLETEAKKKAELDSIIQKYVEEEKAKRLAAKKKQEKELFDSMQALKKVVDQYVRREDETYQRMEDVVSDVEKAKESQQEIVTVERKIPKDSTLDTVNSFFESSSEINVKPSKHSETVEHYDSYITDDYAKTAIEVEKDAVKEMEEVSRPRDWREEFADYKKLHPEMDVEEMMDSFDDYYNGLWDKYNAQNINREIRTRGR